MTGYFDIYSAPAAQFTRDYWGFEHLKIELIIYADPGHDQEADRLYLRVRPEADATRLYVTDREIRRAMQAASAGDYAIMAADIAEQITHDILRRPALIKQFAKMREQDLQDCGGMTRVNCARTPDGQMQFDIALDTQIASITLPWLQEQAIAPIDEVIKEWLESRFGTDRVSLMLVTSTICDMQRAADAVIHAEEQAAV